MTKTISTTYTSGVTLSSTADDPTDITAAGLLEQGLTISHNGAWQITNRGTVQAPSSYGIYLLDGGTVTNRSFAYIGGASGGIAGHGGALTVVNTGRINSSRADAITLAAGGNVTNQVGGTITGYLAIYGAGAPVTVINAGFIGASGSAAVGITLAAGGSVTNQSGGTIAGGGSISGNGPYGGEVYHGDGVDGGTLTNVVNAGLISGYYGVRLINGGAVTNQATGTITGDEGIYGAYHDHASPTLVNAGVIVGNESAVLLFAGGTVTNQATGTLDGAASCGIYGREGNLSVVNYGVISGLSEDGVRVGDAGSVTNQAGGTITGYVGITSEDSPITVLNAGDIAGNPLHDGIGVGLYKGGSVTNLSSGTITGGNAAIFGQAGFAPLTMVNAGLIDGIAGYGIKTNGATSVDNQLGGTITGSVMSIYAQDGVTIDNTGLIGAGAVAGTIAGTKLYLDHAFFNNIVIRGSYGYITNQATGTIAGATGIISYTQLNVANAGTIAGYFAGIGVFAGGTLVNLANATISGLEGIYASTGGYFASTVVNAGLIRGGMTASYGAGIVAPTDGTIVNQAGGTITGFFGIYGGGSRDYFGHGGLTVVNAGYISGAHAAVQFQPGFNDRLAIAPDGTFSGLVDGGNTIGATAASSLELTPGTGGGTLSGLGTQFVNFTQTTIDAGASWTLTGTNTLAAGTTVTNAGTLTLLNATLSDGGDFVNNGVILIDPSSDTLHDLTGTGVTTIEAGSTLNVLGTVTGGETIAFTGGNDLLGANPIAFAGQIDGFTFGDTIELTGVLDGTSAEIVNGNTLQVDRSGSPPVDLTLDPSTSYAGDFYTVSPTGAVTETEIPCFLAGTRIRTEAGEVMVQDLAVGDRVVTLSGRSRPITWIGTGQVLVSPGRRSAATPIIVRKNALADNVPYDDLRLTKGHSLFVDGVLIPAAFLVNHRSILWDDHKRQIEFYHVELDAHDVLIANGSPAESYRDDGN
ncbi:MAG TPA: Hint domain-containing protein, partial [Rhodopila sp.]